MCFQWQINNSSGAQYGHLSKNCTQSKLLEQYKIRNRISLLLKFLYEALCVNTLKTLSMEINFAAVLEIFANKMINDKIKIKFKIYKYQIFYYF
jgi:hypothetical protein